ncbi:MAG: diguanylate cyclase [Thermodesulfobacteriota bacterium]
MSRSEKRVFRLYFAGISFAVAASLGGVFLALAWQSRQLAGEAMLGQARALFHAMVVTREWNASHGGVYALKRPETPPNPFLDEPEILAGDGRVLTLINPATMTRELSEISAVSGHIVYRITSLKPVNPANAPTPFEEEALRAFEAGAPEFSRTESVNGSTLYRYMAPLYTEPNCLPCHARQGYRPGQPRGGISVSFDVGNVHERQEAAAWTIAGVSVLAIGLVTALLSMLMRSMRKRIEEGRKKLRDMAETDELTGIANRRRLLEKLQEEFLRSGRQGAPLACVMLDIDHFKQVNDRLGHHAGDMVLKAVAAALKAGLRGYDMPGRLGGEEFLAVVPGLDREGAAGLAERLRRSITAVVRGWPDMPPDFTLTVSLGVTAKDPEDISSEAMLRRADAALYVAKASGRDRVEVR